MKSALPPQLFRAINSHHGVCEHQTPARKVQIQGFISAILPVRSEIKLQTTPLSKQQS